MQYWHVVKTFFQNYVDPVKNLRRTQAFACITGRVYGIWKIGFPRLVSSTFEIVQIIVQSHFDRVSLLIALKATESGSQLVTQLAV